MTPDQIKAKELVGSLLPSPIHEWRDIVARALAAEREAATMAERERCALHIERRSGSIPFRQEIARELRLGLETP